MTEGERNMLHETHDLTKAIHKALFEVPMGSGENEKPLIQHIRVLVRAYQRGSWAARALIYFIITASSVAVAWDDLISFFTRVQK